MANCRPITLTTSGSERLKKGRGFRVYMKIIFMQMEGTSRVHGIKSLVSTVDLSPFVFQKDHGSLQGETSSLSVRP